MEQIQKQTKIARRRMTSERFLSFLPWTLSIAFVVAAIGLALPKLMHLEVDPTIWIASWVGGVSLGAAARRPRSTAMVDPNR